MKHRLIEFSVPPFSLRCFDLWVLYLVFMTNRSIKSVYTQNENNSNGCSDLLTQSAVNVTDLRDFWHWPSICGLHQTLPWLLDSERSAIFTNELQRRAVNLYGILNSFIKSIPIATPHQPFHPPKSQERKWNSYKNFTSIPDAIKSINAWKWWIALKCHSHGISLILIHVPN